MYLYEPREYLITVAIVCRKQVDDLRKCINSLIDKSNKSVNNFEIIFVSSDKTLDDFLNYFDNMPWYTLPYKKRDLNLLQTHSLLR